MYLMMDCVHAVQAAPASVHLARDLQDQRRVSKHISHRLNGARLRQQRCGGDGQHHHTAEDLANGLSHIHGAANYHMTIVYVDQRAC